MRRGFTLLEMVMVLALLGVLLGMGFPRLLAWLDALAVDRAALEIVALHREAQVAAIVRGERVQVRLTQDSLIASLERIPDSAFIARAGPSRHRVQLTASRDQFRFYPNGLGLGASNTKIVLRRGAAVDSLTTSRLGRLKRWR